MPEDYWVDLRSDGDVYRFRFIGGPIEQPEKNQPVLLAIGHAASAWARMEQHIDAILIQINKIQHSSEIIDLYDPNHPKPFTDKLRMLKSYFNKHPALAHHTEAVRDFASGLTKLAKARNELLHSILEDFDASLKTMTLNKALYRRKTDDFLFLKQTILLERVEFFTRQVNLAHYGMCDVSRDLFSEETLEQLRKP